MLTNSKKHRRQNKQTSPDGNLSLNVYLEKFTPHVNARLEFPQHIVMFGGTGTGKTILICNIMVNIDYVYNLKSTERYAVIVSPYDKCEFVDILGKWQYSWSILHIKRKVIDKELPNDIENYMVQFNILDKEVILIIDDLAIGGTYCKSVMDILLKIFATFRHKNIAVIVSLQVHTCDFYPLLVNCGYVIVMNAIGQDKILEKILRYFLTFPHIKQLVRNLHQIFPPPPPHGGYFAIGLSKDVHKNAAMVISDTVYNPQIGISRQQLDNIEIVKK